MIGDRTTTNGTRQIEPTFEIALICTGNRFRSPIAAEFLRRHGSGLPLELRSLGTRETGARPPLTEALEVAARYGLDLSDHRARSLAGENLERSDLVLGFERVHVAAAVVDAGAARGRSFTLPEFAGLLASISSPAHLGSAAGARGVVAQAARLRTAQTDLFALPELGDPLGGPPRGYWDAAARIEGFCLDLVRGLFGQNAEATRRPESATEQSSGGGR
jgi:protein-tyrosine phosphatase